MREIFFPFPCFSCKKFSSNLKGNIVTRSVCHKPLNLKTYTKKMYTILCFTGSKGNSAILSVMGAVFRLLLEYRKHDY